MDYNRLVKDLNGMTEEQFMNRIKEVCTVKALGEALPAQKPEKREFYMYLNHHWYSLTPNKVLRPCRVGVIVRSQRHQWIS